MVDRVRHLEQRRSRRALRLTGRPTVQSPGPSRVGRLSCEYSVGCNRNDGTERVSRRTDVATGIILLGSLLFGFPAALQCQLQSVRVQVNDRGQADGIRRRWSSRISVGREDVYCTSRQGTPRVYGRQDGGFVIYRQFLRGGSCAFGTPLEE